MTRKPPAKPNAKERAIMDWLAHQLVAYFDRQDAIARRQRIARKVREKLAVRRGGARCGKGGRKGKGRA